MLCRLKHALRTDNIHLKYQPVYSINTKEVLGFEALLRWRDPHFGRVCPETLVTLAASNGLMNTVSVYVIKKALTQMAGLIKKHGIFLSLNLSPADLISASFKNVLMTELRQHHLAPSSILLEITEVPCSDIDALKAGALSLAQEGFRLALDDFGKGCSDIPRLRALPVSEVKIDRALTRALCASRNLHSPVWETCNALYRMPYQLIFEGVETQAQLSTLAERFPRSWVQGWYFSKAVAIDDVQLLLDAPVT